MNYRHTLPIHAVLILMVALLAGCALKEKDLYADWSAERFYREAKRAMRNYDYATAIKDVAAQTGTTTKELQLFQYAAAQVGVKQTEVEKGLERLNTNMSKAASGSRTMRVVSVSRKRAMRVPSNCVFPCPGGARMMPCLR